MSARILRRSFAAAGLFLLLLAGSAKAESLFGGRIGLYTHPDQPYFGVEAVLPLGNGFSANPNAEYVRLGDTQEFTFNADVQYEFAIKGRTLGWAGAGLGLLSTHPDGPGEGNSKDGVANLFLGIGLDTGIGMPYITAKYLTKRDPQFLLGVGMRF